MSKNLTPLEQDSYPLITDVLEIPGRSDVIIVADGLEDDLDRAALIQAADRFSLSSIVFLTAHSDVLKKSLEQLRDGSCAHAAQKNYFVATSPETTIATLQKKGYQLVVTSAHASRAQAQVDFKPEKPMALVVGATGEALHQAFVVSADVALPVESNQDISQDLFKKERSAYEALLRQALFLVRDNIIAMLGRQNAGKGRLLSLIFEQLIKEKADIAPQLVLLMMIIELDGMLSLAQIGYDLGLIGEDSNEDDNFASDLVMLLPEQQEVIVQAIDPLLKRNFIFKLGAYYRLTHQGEQFLAGLWPQIEQVYHKINAEFSGEESNLLCQFFSKEC